MTPQSLNVIVLDSPDDRQRQTLDESGRTKSHVESRLCHNRDSLLQLVFLH